MEEYIDKFTLLITDPRNISPEDFAEYYPEPGHLGNSKNLDKNTIEKHFGEFQKFDITESYNGYISLKAKLYSLIERYNQLSIDNKEVYLNYFALKSKDLNLKTQSYIRDKVLSRKEYFNLLGAYTLFVNNLIKLILNEFQTSLSLEKNTLNIDSKPKKRLEEFFISIDITKIYELQKEFCGLTGKKLAMLIYILDKEFKVLLTNDGSRKGESRIFFVRAFKNDYTIKHIKSVNNYIEGTTGDLKKVNKVTDNIYLNMYEIISNII